MSCKYNVTCKRRKIEKVSMIKFYKTSTKWHVHLYLSRNPFNFLYGLLNITRKCIIIYMYSMVEALTQYNCGHINCRHILRYLSLWTYFSGWTSCLISFVWASPSCEECETSKRFPIKKYAFTGNRSAFQPGALDLLATGDRWYVAFKNLYYDEMNLKIYFISSFWLNLLEYIVGYVHTIHL